MRRLWLGVTSLGIRSGRGVAAMHESDRVIKSMTGMDPAHFHPRIYRIVRDAASQRYDYYRRTHTPLTPEELTLLKLVYFLALARRAQDQQKREKFGGAISKLKHVAGDRIRHEISLEVMARTGF